MTETFPGGLEGDLGTSLQSQTPGIFAVENQYGSHRQAGSDVNIIFVQQNMFCVLLVLIYVSSIAAFDPFDALPTQDTR
jgi:hypothetical protein